MMQDWFQGLFRVYSAIWMQTQRKSNSELQFNSFKFTWKISLISLLLLKREVWLCKFEKIRDQESLFTDLPNEPFIVEMSWCKLLRKELLKDRQTTQRWMIFLLDRMQFCRYSLRQDTLRVLSNMMIEERNKKWKRGIIEKV